jgi:hypothetical protein
VVAPPVEFVFDIAGVAEDEPPQAASNRQRSRAKSQQERFIANIPLKAKDHGK